MLGSIMGAAVALVLVTAPFPTQAQAERQSITLNGHPIEILGRIDEGGEVAWARGEQNWTPCPPLLADPGGPHLKSRYAIEVNGHRAEVLGWVDPNGRFQWLYGDQTWSAVPPRSRASPNPTAAMANGVIASKLDREGKVTASDHQTQAAVESLIESADAGRLKPPSLKKPSLFSFPSIPWGWIVAVMLLVATLGFVGLALILALWLILKRNRT